MTVANAYLDLNVQRRLADYDYTHIPNKDDTLKAIDHAKIGIGSLKKARDRCPEQLDIVCVAMIASGSTRRRMVRDV